MLSRRFRSVRASNRPSISGVYSPADKADSSAAGGGMSMVMSPVDRIAALFAAQGVGDYPGEPVTVDAHLLLAAALAAAAGAPHVAAVEGQGPGTGRRRVLPRDEPARVHGERNEGRSG